MKKSEMLAKLKALIDDPGRRDMFTGEYDQPTPEEILDVIEDAGMKPPQYRMSPNGGWSSYEFIPNVSEDEMWEPE